MITAIIIDDEQNCIDSLVFDLQKHCKDVEILESCTTPKQGLLSIKKHRPDLVFLDVQMPWMSGFEMLELLDKIDFAIIFTTAFDQFAAKAFRISAIDYLLKPIDIHDLKEAIKKASEKIQQKSGTDNIANFLQNIKKPEVKQRIAVPGREGYEFIEAGKIIYAKAEGSYTHVFLNDKRKLIVSKTLSDIEELLPAEHFQRIHHSTLVNLSHITHLFKTDGGFVVLDNGEKLAVSKSRKESLMERLGLK
ncbi:MAG TPA: LytTR family DNA-binding domain-containing protein [Chitinophagaceae bacterium]|nr:LytTR family DNA-binding domain-containing protein [Chitinophagaceae bacterium]